MAQYVLNFPTKTVFCWLFNVDFIYFVNGHSIFDKFRYYSERNVVKIGEKYDFFQRAGKYNVRQLLPCGNADILKSQKSLYHSRTHKKIPRLKLNIYTNAVVFFTKKVYNQTKVVRRLFNE